MYIVQVRINKMWVDLTFHSTKSMAIDGANSAINDGNDLVRIVKRKDEVIKMFSNLGKGE
jgi:hypothetical protein